MTPGLQIHAKRIYPVEVELRLSKVMSARPFIAQRCRGEAVAAGLVGLRAQREQRSPPNT